MKEDELRTAQQSAQQKMSKLGNQFRNLSQQVSSDKNDSTEALNDVRGRIETLNSTLATTSNFVRDLMLMTETDTGTDAMIGNSTVIKSR